MKRGGDETTAVYAGAGHIFLMQDFLPPVGSPNAPPYDFGGSLCPAPPQLVHFA